MASAVKEEGLGPMTACKGKPCECDGMRAAVEKVNDQAGKAFQIK